MSSRSCSCIREMMNMKDMKLLVVFITIIASGFVSSSSSSSSSSCFPSLFSFGDSKADTGNLQAAYPTESRSERPPYGISYFGYPADRFCDGRLVIDFQAQAYGLPGFLHPYFGVIDVDFRHGVNFAMSSSAVIPDYAVSPFYLQRQFNQFKKFKSHYVQHQCKDSSYLPPNVYFGEGLYVISTGENDYRAGIVTNRLTVDEVKELLVPDVIQYTRDVVEGLYEEGARNFLVVGIAADGCISRLLTLLPHQPEDLDSLGCVKAVNNYVQYHNEKLLEAVIELRSKLEEAHIAFGDYFGINVDILLNATAYGFTEKHKACCGYGGEYNYNATVQCGETGVINGRNMSVGACPNPSDYINWDGIHLTQHFYELVAKAFLEGNFVDQPIPLPPTCTLNFSSFPNSQYSSVL